MILVTGAFGNAGQFVVQHLLENGLDVVAVDINNAVNQAVFHRLLKISEQYHQKLNVYWADFSEDNNSELKRAFSENTLSGVVHLAFIIPPFTELHPERSKIINVDGTRRIVELAYQYAPMAPFVFSSSTTVYGPVSKTEQYVSEQHPIQATSQYTGHKIECEGFVQKSRLDWRILRFSAVMNPVFDPDVESIKFGMHISLDVHIEPVHVRDVSIAVHHALIRTEASKKILIVSGGSKTQMLYRDYIFNVLRGAMGGDLKQEDIPWEKFIDKPYYLHWYDTTESQRILSYQHLTVDDFIRDKQKQMAWWQKLIVLIIGKKRAIRHYFSRF